MMRAYSLTRPSCFSNFVSKLTKYSVTREAVLLLLYMAVSAMTLNVFMQTRSFEEGSKKYGLAAMLNGSAERPFVYRQLLPILANSAVELIPEHDREGFVKYHLDKYHLKQQYFESAKFRNQNIEQWTPSYALKFHFIYIANFMSLLGLAYILRFLVSKLYGGKGNLTLIAPVMFLLMLPMSFLHGNFYYDFAELFFLASLLIAAISGRYLWWVLLLPLAVLNKESNILVPILYLPIVISSSHSARSRLSIALAMILAGLAYFYTKQLYEGNPGGTTIWHLEENIRFWLNPESYFLWQDFYAPLIPFPRGLNIFVMLTIASLVTIAWAGLSNQLKWLLAMAFAINVPLWMLYCYTDEMRNLSFTFLPLFIVATQAFTKLFVESSLPDSMTVS